MPRYTVELSFEYKVTYEIDAETPRQALDAAIAKDDAISEADRPTLEPVGGLLDSRVFDENGNEVLYDSDGEVLFD